jgi:hypothetical protein
VKIWKFELSGNFAARQKPVHLLLGYTVPDWTLLIGATFNSEFVKR